MLGVARSCSADVPEFVLQLLDISPVRKSYWNFWNVVDWVSILLAFAILITWISQNIGQAEKQ